ncbi:MAG: hypothetical protein H7315_13290 [Herminiimonas sp.]|nr:hypothetical protein [Herminiimonas sp.]
MEESIFKNFNPEQMQYELNCKTPFGIAPNLHMMISQAVLSCSKWTVDEVSHCRSNQRLSNAGFAELFKEINYLAEIGFDNRATYLFLELDGARAEHMDLDEHPINEWAIHGMECSGRQEATEAQIYAFTCLKIIDFAMTDAVNDGINLTFIESLAEAAFYLSYARDADANESVKFVRNGTTLNMESQFRDRQRNIALKGATNRHAVDPKQRDKKFVFECWTDWQVKPEQYKGKADFARSMVDKCEHLESTKVIEDWCRAWAGSQKV